MIAFNSAEEAFFPAMFSLQIVPVAGGAPRVLVPGHNGAFFAFTWLPDGKRLLATVHDAARGGLPMSDLILPLRFEADAAFLEDLPYDPEVLFFDALLELAGGLRRIEDIRTGSSAAPSGARWQVLR